MNEYEVSEVGKIKLKLPPAVKKVADKAVSKLPPKAQVAVNKVTAQIKKAGENINYEIKGAQNVQSQYLAKQNSNELIIIGSAKPIPLDLAALRESFARLQPVDRNYLKLTSLDSPEAIFNLLLFKGEELRGYYEDGTIITDDKPSLEFSTPFRLVEKSPQLVNQAMDAVLNYIKLSQD